VKHPSNNTKEWWLKVNPWLSHNMHCQTSMFLLCAVIQLRSVNVLLLQQRTLLRHSVSWRVGFGLLVRRVLPISKRAIYSYLTLFENNISDTAW